MLQFRRCAAAVGVLLVLISGMLCGQQKEPAPVPPDPALSFEVASIRPLESSVGPFHFNVLPNRLDVKNMNLRFLIEDAYDLPHFQVVGPDSMVQRHFDIVATGGRAVNRAEMRIMLRNLLTERFHLKTHWDSRTETIYRLETLPTGGTMKTVADGYPEPNSPSVGDDTVRLSGPMSMRQLANSLFLISGRPVLDVTGLEGYFKIALLFASDGAGAGESNAPFLMKAIQEQLGLRLVPSKGPVRVLVVDHADDVPVAN